MKTIQTTIALAALMATPAFAQVLDADGDGNVTMEEFAAVYPDTSEDVFTTMDTDEDGVLSALELQAAIDAGLLPG